MKLQTHRLRLLIISLFFVCLLILLLWRIIDLTIISRKFLKNQGDARSVRIIDIPAYRGMITDRHGSPLAVSTPVSSIWINPKEFSATKKQLQRLAILLDMPLQILKEKAVIYQGKEFLYLKRQLPPNRVQKIADLKLSGLNIQQEFKRFYPEADSTGQLIGFTNIDDLGIEGIELAYQDWLMGIPGKKRIVQDRKGNIVEVLDIIKAPKPGRDLKLSIDKRIQYFAYHQLKETLTRFAAQSGSVVVLDTKTGELLAVVNAPSFNPNARTYFTKSLYRNRAFTDVFEPGSVIKPFSIASALESGLFTPDSIVNTNPSYMMVHGKLIRDIHNYGVLSVTGVLQHSSNVGVSKMVLSSPADKLIDLFQRSGFGQRTDTAYPGENEGIMVRVKNANPFVLATLSFGYGLSTTTLQLARAYSIFANQGKLLAVNLLHDNRHSSANSPQVMDKKVANQVLTMLEAVLGNEGTGKMARVSGYRVAGKTGTARIAKGKKGYDEKRYISSFIGIAPVSNPRLVVAVIIHEPSLKNYYGAMVAAPLFSQIMAQSLRLLDIPADTIRD